MGSYGLQECIAVLGAAGQVPSLEEANRREGVITLPWQEKPLELGMMWHVNVSWLEFCTLYI